MRIVIPVSAHDCHLLPGFLENLLQFGSLHNHVVTFSPTLSQREAVLDASEKLAPLCGDVSVLNIDFESSPSRGWPYSPNAHFAHTVYALEAIGNVMPWFWMEQDCTVDKSGWADDLAQGWASSRKPFFGHIVPTPHRDKAGNIISKEDDTMMMGCCVYPPNMLNLRSAVNMFRQHHAEQCPEPWDVHMRFWFRSFGWTHTDLIGDRWNTQNYRLENGIMVCDPAPTQFVGRDHSREDISGACVIHGCKDGSLARLLQRGIPELTASPQPIVVRNQPVDNSAELEALRVENAKLKAKIAELEKPKVAPPAATPLNGSELPSIESLRAEASKKTTTVPKLARKMGVDKTILKTHIEQPSARMQVNGRAQWIRVLPMT